MTFLVYSCKNTIQFVFDLPDMSMNYNFHNRSCKFENLLSLNFISAFIILLMF